MAEALERLRTPLKLRRDAIFLQTEKGILFRSRKGSFSFQGRSIYRTFQQLLPHLQGRGSGEAVLASLRPEMRAPVGDLLRRLLDCDVLQPVDEADALLLSPSVAEAFTMQVEFIAHMGERPSARFLRFRESRVLLLGEGAGLLSAGLALLRNGLRTLHLQDASTRDLKALETECARQGASGVPSELAIDPAIDPAGFDMVLYCSAQPALGRLSALNRAAVAGDFRLLPAVITHGTLLVGPLVEVERPGCLECAWLRWSEHLPAERASLLWQAIATGREPEAGPRSYTELQAKLLGNTAALEAFRLLVGELGAESEQAMLVQNLATFESTVKSLLPHPACTACGVAPVALPEFGIEDETSARSCVSRWTSYTDPEFGFLTRLDDDDVEQLPLRISVLCYPAQRSGPHARDGAMAVGWDVDDVVQSRLRALQWAVEDKGFLSADALLRARLTTSPQAWQEVVPSHRIGGWLGISSGEETMPLLEMWDLHAERPLLAPAAAVHPAFSTGLFDYLQAGVGASCDLEEATQRALFSLTEAVALTGIATGVLSLCEWSDSAEPETPRGRYLRAAYAQRRQPGERLLLCQPLPGVFTVIITEPERTSDPLQNLPCGSGFSPAEAVEEALSELLARGQLEGAGRSLPTRPGRRAMFPIGGESFSVCPDELQSVPSPSSVGDVIARLAAEGRTLARIELTPRDVALTRTFVLVKLLLLNRDERAS